MPGACHIGFTSSHSNTEVQQLRTRTVSKLPAWDLVKSGSPSDSVVLVSVSGRASPSSTVGDKYTSCLSRNELCCRDTANNVITKT